MPAEPQYGSVPFTEAIDHFKSKLNLSTPYWDAIDGQTHAKAFTVAGATKLDLLSDLRQAAEDAITNGTTITEFRKQFDKAVAKHGWSYNGKRGWRTRVIYDTNLRTAHAAGAWQQAQETNDSRPYLQYMTAGDGRVRPQHAAWDEKVFPIDSPWWNTHYPPNGWGCRCTTRTLSQRQMESEGFTVSEPPPLDLTERINVNSGEVYGEVPKGIDPGWDYNVGKAWLAPDIAFGEKIMQMPESMRRAALEGAKDLVPYLQQQFSPWANSLLDRKQALGEVRTVGYLSNEVADGMMARGVMPSTAVITVTDRDIMHALRPDKSVLDKAVPPDMVRALPDLITSPEAVLWDKNNPGLLYVFSVPGDTRHGKFVVKVNYAIKARGVDNRRHSVVTNTVRTGTMVPLASLKNTGLYEVLSGKL